jgi:mannose-6-phosphate isomerase-like protein (cupin superfamily)
MAVSRFQRRVSSINDNELYKKAFKDRGLKFIEQYRTAKLVYPTDEQIASMTFDDHLWTMGDRYYKLAYKYYGESEYWWVIAWFNKKPTEHLLSAGDLLYIPTNLEEILDYLDI